MGLKEYRIEGFGGGLITEVDESIIDPKMSPHMLNIDVGDTGALRRRNGYRLAASVCSGDPINAFSRIYWNDGTKGWFYISATSVYQADVVASETPATTKKLDVTSLSGTPDPTMIPYSSAYNGQLAMCASADTSATVPDSNSITVYGVDLTGSIKIDGGAYVSITGTPDTYTFSPSSATHTIYFKRKAANTSSLLVYTNSGIPYARRAVSASASYVGISFRDDGTNYTDAIVGEKRGVTADFSGGDVFMGLNWNVSASHYVLGDPLGYYTTVVNASDNPLDRTTGWHHVEYKKDTYGIWHTYFDGVDQYYPGSFEVLDYVVLYGAADWGNPESGSRRAHFDRYVVNGAIVDDMGSSSGWTPIVGSVRTCATYYVSASLPIALDKIIYSNLGTATYIDSLNASSEYYAIEFAHDKVMYSTDYDVIRTYDHSVVATLTTGTPNFADRAGFLTLSKDRLFAAGPYNHRVRLAVSAPNDPDSFSVALDAAVMAIAASGSGDLITGMAPYGGALYVFQRSRCHKLAISGDATTDYIRTDVSQSNGCIAPRSLALSERGMCFLSADGVRGFGSLQSMFANDGTGFSILSKNIRGLNHTVDDNFYSTSGAPSETERNFYGYTNAERVASVGAIYKNKYWFFIANDVYVFSLSQKTADKQPVVVQYSYAGLDSASTRVTSVFVARGDEYALYVGTNNGMIYQLDVGNDDSGADIHYEYKTPPLAFGEFNSVKHIRRTYIGSTIVGLSATSLSAYDMSVEYDTSDVNIAPSTVSVSVTTDTNPIRLQTSTRGHYIQYTLSGSQTGYPVEISRLSTVYVDPKEKT